MATKYSTQLISITSMGDGGTLALPLSNSIGLYVIDGDPVITGSLNIASSGTAMTSHSLKILVRTGATLGEMGVLAIEGVSIGVSADDRLFEAIYDGASWKVFQYTTVTPV